MKLYVWDFHGVLEKDNEKSVIEISNNVLRERGYKQRFSEEDNERFYGLKWYQYFERLLPSLTKEECLILQSECFKYMEEHLELLEKHIKPNDNVIEVLTQIAKSEDQQIVISNTRQNDLEWFVNAIGISEFFNDRHIIGVNAHQKHGTKADALKAYLGSKSFDKIIVIGDSEDDLILGKEVEATTYFYKHPGRQHEETEKADYIIKDLREVLKN